MMHILSVVASVAAISLYCYGQEATANLQTHTISATGIDASYIGYGARLTKLYINDKNGEARDIVLGYDEGTQYINDTEHEHTYFGAVIGRYSGRMKNATFALDGTSYHVTANENNGADSLHGGTVGYDQRNWTVANHNASTITFMLLDDAFEGYPGRIVSYATFSVGPETSLTSRLVSIALDATTPIMLTTHPYFNLDAFVDPTDPTILEHEMHMPFSQRYVEIDNIEVPTGRIGVTTKTLLDFTTPRTLGSSISAGVRQCGSECTGIDTNFIIDRPFLASSAIDAGSSANNSAEIPPVLTVSSKRTGIKLDLYTNQEALIVYTCNKLNGTIPLKKSQQTEEGRTLFAGEHGCVAIETQGWIDGVNHADWGQWGKQVYGSKTAAAEMWTRYVFGIV